MDLDAWSPAAANPELSITRVKHELAELVECRGELDLATAPQLRAGIQQALVNRPRRLVVDLCQVRFVDSSGLSALLEASRDAREAAVELRFACDVASTLRLLELTQLSSVLSVHRTREQALAETV